MLRLIGTTQLNTFNIVIYSAAASRKELFSTPQFHASHMGVNINTSLLYVRIKETISYCFRYFLYQPPPQGIPLYNVGEIKVLFFFPASWATSHRPILSRKLCGSRSALDIFFSIFSRYSFVGGRWDNIKIIRTGTSRHVSHHMSRHGRHS